MEQKGNGKGLKTFGILGAAAIICSSILFSGSAALNGGGFFIHAHNNENPKIEAQAGMRGSGSGDNTGNPPANDRILATYSCGPETFNYTQSMKDLTEANLALHEQGRDAEMKKGPGGWEAVNVLDGSILGGQGTMVVAVGSVQVAESKDLLTLYNSGEMTTLYNTNYAPRGNTNHNINAVGIKHGSNTAGISFGLFEGSGKACSYTKQIDGKISSPDGSPAFFGFAADSQTSHKVNYWHVGFAKDGKFYRAGGKPQLEAALSSDGVPSGPYAEPAYNVVSEFHYPAGTDIAEASDQNIYTVTERAYSADYPRS